MLVASIEVVAATAICRLRGEADAVNAAELRATIADLADHRRVVLDFSGVSIIDSAGLGCVIVGVRRMQAAGAAIVLSSPRRTVHRRLLTLGVERVVAIVDTIGEALALLEQLPVPCPGASSSEPARAQPLGA